MAISCGITVADDRSMLKVVSYSAMYWYMCRLDAGRCHRVVNKAQPFIAVHFVVVPAAAQFVVVPVVNVHHTWSSHKLRVVRAYF